MIKSPRSPTGLPFRGAGLFCHEVWNVGLVRQSAADIVARGLSEPVEWFPEPAPWTFLADPFCRLEADGGRRLYAERLDYWQGRGEIWSARLAPGAGPAGVRFRPLLGGTAHLSYPFPFTDDRGRPCLTTESWEAGVALLWEEGPEGLRAAGTLMAGRPVVDPTLWRGPDRWWLFCTFENDGPNQRLYLFHAPSPCGPWTAHPGNPVVDDPASARPAGPLFMADGVLVRPSQDCSRTYGGAVVLNAVRRLDPEGYGEEAIRRLAPVAPYHFGLHTLCPAGGWTLVDGKRWRFHVAEPLRKLAVGLRRRRDHHGRRKANCHDHGITPSPA